MNPIVDRVLAKESRWQAEMTALRAIVLSCGLTEDFKWGQPCYTLDNRNIVLIHGFKDYCALLFFKGALLGDPDGLLVQQTKNVQAARQIRFAELGEIKAKTAAIKACIFDAIEIERAGLKVVLEKNEAPDLPDVITTALIARPALKSAFEKLTSGRKRAYALFFSEPKQLKTQIARLEKSVAAIMAGKGPNER